MSETKYWFEMDKVTERWKVYSQHPKQSYPQWHGNYWTRWAAKRKASSAKRRRENELDRNYV